MMRRAEQFAAPFSLWLLAVVLEGTFAQEAPGFSPLSGLFTAFAANSPAQSSSSGFIAVNGQSFTDQSCREFIPIGWCAWTDVNLVAKEAAAAIPLPVANLSAQDDAIAQYFKTASDTGFNVVRVFGHGNSTSFELQTGPGQYDESVFRGFDYILALASLHNIKVIFVVINNWLDQSVGGGKLKYCQWANLSDEDLFWTDPTAMHLVQNHLSVLANRRNTFTGVIWRQDPTIFYWELFYEPRCPAAGGGAGCPGAVTSWYDSMASYMKTVDGNHLISTGEEGFFAVNSTLIQADPSGVPTQDAEQGRFWSANLGQDFEEQHRRQDFAVFQLWPDSWNTSDPLFASNWIGNHTHAAGSLGKPLILDEFGKASYQADESDRIALFNSVYTAVDQSLVAKASLKGAIFWRWLIDSSDQDRTTVAPGQPTFSMIQSQVQQLQSYSGSIISQCGEPSGNVLAFTQQSG